MIGSHTTREGEGEVIDLGMATMRLLAPSELTGGGFTLSEFAGAEGPWTVFHVHNHMEESFLVLEGRFTFAVGDGQIEAESGTYVLVKRGTPHMMTAHEGEVAC
jgi:quercetin dioxygenase-like cupin family protein